MADKFDDAVVAVKSGIICAVFAYIANTQGYTLNIPTILLWSIIGANIFIILSKRQ
jgi:uncharacterized membrane protein YjjP (DUF1212 family)